MDEGSGATKNNKHRHYHRSDANFSNAVVVRRFVFAVAAVVVALAAAPGPAGEVVQKMMMTLPVADAAGFDGGGYQTGSASTEGSFFSGGLVYDHSTDTTYMAGIHYNDEITDVDGNMMEGSSPVRDKTNCYIASLNTENNHLIYFRSLGHPDFMETCTSITASVGPRDELVVVGSIEGDGLNSYTTEDNYGFDFEYSATHPNRYNDYDNNDKSKQPPPILGTISTFTKHADHWVDRMGLVSGSIFTEHTPEKGHQNSDGQTEDEFIDPKFNLFYPVSVVTQRWHKNYLYVAALTSRSETPLTNADTSSSKQQTNWNNDIYDHSDDKEEPPTYLTVFKFQIHDYQEGGEENGQLKPDEDFVHHHPPELVWKTPFVFYKPKSLSMEGSKGHYPVDIGGMEILTEKDAYGLIIVGNTRLIGHEWGTHAHGNSIQGAYNTTHDEDGFVIMINPTTGERIEDIRIVNGGSELFDAIQDGKSQEDITEMKKKSSEYVRGICVDDNDPKNFAVVGSTTNHFVTDTGEHGGIRQWFDYSKSNFVKNGWAFWRSTSSFVRKYSNVNYPTPDVYRETMHHDKYADIPPTAGISESWTKQWVSQPSWKSKNQNSTKTEAIDCVVHGGFLYVVGNVYDSAHMMTLDGTLRMRASKTNIWIAKMDYETGEVVWTAQVGGEGYDSVTPTGKSIAVNKKGNVIVYGDTTSNLYRKRDSDKENSDKNDVFVMTISGNDGTIIENRNTKFQGSIRSNATMSSTYIPSTDNGDGSNNDEESNNGDIINANGSTNVDINEGIGIVQGTDGSTNVDINEGINIVQATDESVSSLMVKMRENKLQAILYSVSILTGLFALYVFARRCFCPNGCNCCEKKKNAYDRDSNIVVPKQNRNSYASNNDNSRDEFHDEEQ